MTLNYKPSFIRVNLFVVIYSLVFINAKSVNLEINKDIDPPTIEMPEIPANLKKPSERADYLILHFWDKLDFKDTSKSHDKNLMEQSLVNFLSIQSYSSDPSINLEGFKILLHRAHEDSGSYKLITSLADNYLFDLDSPMYSEKDYITFLEALKSAPGTTETEVMRIEDRVEMISKNPVGSVATDFSYTTIQGKGSSLLQSLPEDGQLLLIFFDPDCENCDRVMLRIQEDENLKSEIKTGKLDILAVYSGENKTSWERKAKSLPEYWTIGINQGEIDENELYFLPSMPTVYLLDNEGKILKRNLKF